MPFLTASLFLKNTISEFMSVVDTASSQLIRFGTRGFEELYIDSKNQVPLAGPKRGWSMRNAQSKRLAEEFALSFFDEQRELTKAGYHVCKRIWIFSPGNPKARKLFEYFCAGKAAPEILEVASKDASKIRHAAAMQIIEAQNLMGEARQKEKKIIEDAEAEAARITGEADKTLKQAIRLHAIARIQLAKTQEFVDSPKPKRHDFLDTYIKCTDGLACAASAFLKHLSFFKRAFEDAADAKKPLLDELRERFLLCSNGKPLVYFVELNATARIVEKYLDYKEDSSLLYEFEEEILSELYPLATYLQDTRLIERLDGFFDQESLTNEELLERLQSYEKVDESIEKFQDYFPALVALDFRYISTKVMILVLDSEVVTFDSELSLWRYFVRWAQFRAENSNISLDEFLLANKALVERIHFENMDRKESIEATGLACMTYGIREMVAPLLLKDPSIGRSRVYIVPVGEGGKVSLRYSFNDIVTHALERVSPNFRLKGRLLCLKKIPQANESQFIGINNQEKTDVKVSYVIAVYKQTCDAKQMTITPTLPWGLTLSKEKVLNYQNMDVRCVIELVESEPQGNVDAAGSNNP